MALKRFETLTLNPAPDATAPDGSLVRLLPRLESASMAHFELAAGKTSIAITHRSIEEIWFFLSGSGQMWRKLGEQVEVVDVHANVSLTIPPGTHFQFRSFGPAPLTAIGTQIPPWPGDDEAVRVPGIWPSVL